MRVLLIGCLACSTPAPAHEPAINQPVPAPSTTTAPAPIPAPDTGAVALENPTFIDVPALAPPQGSTSLIGLTTHGASAALSPAGDVLALAGDLAGVQLIHIPTGRGLAARMDLACKEPDPKYVGPCRAQIAFARDGKHVAAWWRLTQKLVVLAVPSGKTEFEAKIDSTSRLEYLDDGRLVALRADVSYVYDGAGTRTELAIPGYARRMSPDGREIVIDGDELSIVDVATKKPIALPKGVALAEVAWAPDGTRVASTRGDWPDVITWKAGSVRTLASSQGARSTIGGAGVNGWAFPPPYDRVYVGMTDGLVGVGLDGKTVFRSSWLQPAISPGSVVRVRDELVVLTGSCALRLDAGGAPLPGRICPLRPAVLAFDGDKLVSIPWNGGIAMTFDRTGKLVASMPLDRVYPSPSALAMFVRDPALAARIGKALALPDVKRGSFQLSRDARRLFVNTQAHEASIIDLTTNRARTKLMSFVASGDGSHIAMERADRADMVDIRTVEPDRLVRSITVPGTTRMVLSDDGAVLVAEADLKIAVIDVASGKIVFEPPCHSSYAGHLVLSRDGRRLACDDGADVVVYDLRTKQPVKRIAHPDTDTADTFAFSDDGKRIAISADNVWVVDL